MIEELHLELTSRCLLQCPKCPRTIYRGTYDISDLDYDLYTDLLTKLDPKVVNFCGNLGDPIYHPKFIDFVKFAHSLDKPILLSTAAYGKKTAWWQELFDSYKSGEIRVGLDGLEDTAHLYRVGTKYKQVFDVMRMGAKQDKRIVWQWIPFSFNEHQIEEARKIAQDNGIVFEVRVSSRFEGPDDPMRPNRKEYQLGYQPQMPKRR
jgi:MoaA/NifB/PqqE/SkfB family radical SAM enzyme